MTPTATDKTGTSSFSITKASEGFRGRARRDRRTSQDGTGRECSHARDGSNRIGKFPSGLVRSVGNVPPQNATVVRAGFDLACRASDPARTVVDAAARSGHAGRPLFHPTIARPRRRIAFIVTDLEPSSPPVDTWEAILEALRRRYPGQKDSVLFCIHKLQQNPDISLRDFRAEADLHGIPVAGRALHSAKTLLGMLPPLRSEQPEPEQSSPRIQLQPPRKRRGPAAADEGGGSIEQRVVQAVRQIQDAAGAEADQMRAAIRQAIAILQRALGD